MIIWILFLVWWLIAFIPTIYVNAETLLKGYAGMTLAPFVLYKGRRYLNDDAFIRHEQAHIFQQRVFSPLLFLLLYGANYLVNRMKGMDHYTAYYNLFFEKLARRAERK